MADNQNQNDQLMKLMQRFINLANKMKDEGKEVPMVNTALMIASGTYSTYMAAGNEGYLEHSGVEKIVQAYADNLMKVQAIKKQQHNPDA